MRVDRLWVESLKEGDQVARQKSMLGSVYWERLSITKVTPSGRLNLSDGTVVNPDGYLRGMGYINEHIEPLTDDIRQKIWRESAKGIVESYRFDFDKMSDRELKELHILVTQYPKREERYYR